MPVQRQFTFYPRTLYDCINTAGHTYKNTTHQNIVMHYLQFIFLNCTAVMPPTLPLTFRCLNKFQFTFTWWGKIDCLMSPCIIHLHFCLLKKNVGILINYRVGCNNSHMLLGCNNSHMLLHVHSHQTWAQIVTVPTVPHKS